MPTELITWLYVENVSRSASFYREGLGLRPILQQGDCVVLGLSETAFLGLCQRAEPRETPGLLLCFVDEDVEGRVAQLVAAGAVLEQAPADNPRYGIVHAFLRDPDGHRVEVQRFHDANWKAPGPDA